jgi:hypothetical protein
MPLDLQNKIEGFDAKNPIISYDILLRTLLFGMVFYVVNNKLTEQLLSNFRSVFDIGLLQTLIFCAVYLLISMNL